jgi:hypothetical protein
MADISITLFVESTTHSMEELLCVIGVPSDCGWRKGTARGKTGKVFVTDSWAITTKRHIPEDIDQIEKANHSAVEELLNKIRGHESRFKEMARYGVAGLRISIVSELLPPCILSADILRQIGVLGVDLEIEIAAA